MVADLTMHPLGLPTPQDLVRELRHLPSAPKVLPRLKELLADGNSSMHEVVALVRLDPAIAARVLQMGNSAYFSKGVRCFTVDEAVNRVGYGQVYELVSYAVASQVLVRPLESYGIEADELWKMSVACALAAETLAVRTGQDRDVAYTVGLLHSLGLVVIDDWALRQRRHLVLPSMGFPREATEAERALLGFTQADAGSALLLHWGFPASMCEPVRWQYSPRACAAHPRMAGLVHCAKWLRSVICAEASGPRPALPHESVLQLLPLRPGELTAMVGGVAQRLQEVSSLLEPGRPARRDGAHRFPAEPAR
jgi:HD-like signal output (HDOD) protein